jgi:hypothetical protein
MFMFMTVAECFTFMSRVVMAVVFIRVIMHMGMDIRLMEVGVGVAFSE